MVNVKFEVPFCVNVKVTGKQLKLDIQHNSSPLLPDTYTGIILDDVNITLFDASLHPTSLTGSMAEFLR